jgi:uncharacterized protein YecE (DUF72 family)
MASGVMKTLRIGSCSWKYPSWEGLVYSSREPEDFLEEYARRYDTVEVDQWFWSLGKSGTALPKKEVVAGYDAATPTDFRFTVKCPNAITMPFHRAAKGAAPVPNPRFLEPGLFLAFLDALAPLVPKIGLFIFQFEYFNRDKMVSRAAFTETLAAFLETLPADLPYAVEIRNPRWLDGPWLDFLRERRVAPVLLQGYWMDDICGILEVHGDRLGDRLCLRLHGEDREGIEERSGEDWSKVIRPKDEELERIVGFLRKLPLERMETYLNINNHYEGSAPVTMGKVRELLADVHG